MRPRRRCVRLPSHWRPPVHWASLTWIVAKEVPAALHGWQGVWHSFRPNSLLRSLRTASGGYTDWHVIGNNNFDRVRAILRWRRTAGCPSETVLPRGRGRAPCNAWAEAPLPRVASWAEAPIPRAACRWPRRRSGHLRGHGRGSVARQSSHRVAADAKAEGAGTTLHRLRRCRWRHPLR